MKNILFSIIFFGLSTMLYAQVSFKPGARAGFNLANVSQTNGDTKTDFYFGGLLELQLGNVYALQPEVNYSRQGSKSSVSGVDDLELQYVGIAIINKFKPIQDLGLHFIIGPGLDIKVKDNVDYIEAAPIDLVFFGGIGYDLPHGLSIEARYKTGIIDIDDGFTQFGDDSADQNNLNGVIQVGVVYKFDFNN